MGRGEIAHNAAQIARYLELVWPLIEKGIVMPDEPPDRKHKGSSRPPVTDRGLGIMWANRVVTPMLEPILREAQRGDHSYGGIQYSDLLSEMVHDPGAMLRHRTEQSLNPPFSGPNGARAQAFFKMCDHIARVLAIRHKGPDGPCQIEVYTRPAREEEELQAQDPRSHGKGRIRAHTAHDSYRTMVSDMERMVLAGTHSKEGAKAAKADQLGCSMGRVRDAVTFVNHERETVFSFRRGKNVA